MLAVAAAVAGCGSGKRDVTVYAASSLRDAFPAITRAATYDFAGSDTLQTQIEHGAPADVFASASPKQAQALYREGRCSRPLTFATNRLVLIVPRGQSPSLSALRAGGRRLAIGSAGVPVGDYTREVLRRLDLSAILRRNTVSQETDVASITAKVALGSADAGFVYRTDAQASRRVVATPLPGRAQPPVRYAICAVHDSAAAQAFIARVRSPAGRQVLARSGFGLP